MSNGQPYGEKEEREIAAELAKRPTMPGDYSEELVELVRAAVVKALSKPGELSLGITVLDALSSSGRLVPEGSEVRERIAATAETLHVVAGWGFVPAEELHRVAQEVEAGDVADWTFCPVCEEIECDAGCPLAPVRSPSVPDTEEGVVSEVDFSRPCEPCRDGQHERCAEGFCGCIAQHSADDAIMRNFKRLKRQMHPERETWTKGGWS